MVTRIRVAAVRSSSVVATIASGASAARVRMASGRDLGT
jgi:hypothetical protein